MSEKPPTCENIAFIGTYPDIIDEVLVTGARKSLDILDEQYDTREPIDPKDSGLPIEDKFEIKRSEVRRPIMNEYSKLFAPNYREYSDLLNEEEGD